MPGLTKKKKKVSSGPLVLKKPKAKVSTRVKNFVDKHKKELKALGWVAGAMAVPPIGAGVVGYAALKKLEKRRKKKGSSEYVYLGKKATTGKGR
jgi:hypothetical protein